MRTRQELLESLLQKEMEDLRKRCFKYKRRPFLKNKVTIVEADLNEADEEEKDNKQRTAGRYEKENIKNDYKFDHKILIDTVSINQYIDTSRFKKYFKRKLREIIRHELTHCFVAEHIEPYSKIKGTYRDASPIFLSVLEFFFGRSYHKCAYDFENGSEIYIDVISFIENFEQLEKYIGELMLDYEKVAEKLKQQIIVNNDKSVIIGNEFEYAHRNAGLIGFTSVSEIVTYRNNQFYAFAQSNRFEIGCNVTPNMIRRLVERKINSKSFGIVCENKRYVDLEKSIMLNKNYDGKLYKIKLDEPKSA